MLENPKHCSVCWVCFLQSLPLHRSALRKLCSGLLRERCGPVSALTRPEPPSTVLPEDLAPLASHPMPLPSAPPSPIPLAKETYQMLLKKNLFVSLPSTCPELSLKWQWLNHSFLIIKVHSFIQLWDKEKGWIKSSLSTSCSDLSVEHVQIQFYSVIWWGCFFSQVASCLLKQVPPLRAGTEPHHLVTCYSGFSVHLDSEKDLEENLEQFI